jgi:hypothetical protein
MSNIKLSAKTPVILNHRELAQVAQVVAKGVRYLNTDVTHDFILFFEPPNLSEDLSISFWGTYARNNEFHIRVSVTHSHTSDTLLEESGFVSAMDYDHIDEYNLVQDVSPHFQDVVGSLIRKVHKSLPKIEAVLQRSKVTEFNDYLRRAEKMMHTNPRYTHLHTKTNGKEVHLTGRISIENGRVPRDLNFAGLDVIDTTSEIKLEEGTPYVVKTYVIAIPS